MNYREKCERLLACDLTPGRRAFVESCLGMIRLSPEVYPSEAQRKILAGLWRQYGRSDVEKEVTADLGR